MFWHNGLNWKKYLVLRDRQRAAYRRAGMTEAQIAAIEEFDEEVFRSDRRFYEHNCPHHDADSPEKTPEPAAPEADGMPAGVRLRWDEEIGDPDLLALLKRQPPEILRLVVLLVVEGYSQREAARRLGVCPQRVNYLWLQFRRDAVTFLEGRARRRSAAQEQGAEKEEAALRPIGQTGGGSQLADQEAEALQGGVEPPGEAAGRVGPGADAAADTALVAQEEE